MYKCKYCSRSYAWKQSLKRHVQHSHVDEESDEYEDSNMDISDDSSDTQQSNVSDDNGDDSSKDDDDSSGEGSEVESGDGEDEENDSASSGESEADGEDEAVWIDVVDDIVKQFQAQHEQKLQHFKGADALELTEEAMHPMYKRALKQRIAKQLLFDYMLRRSKYYTKLESDLKKFVKKHSLSRAVRATLRKNDNILEEMLDDYDEQKAIKDHVEVMDAAVDGQ